MMCDILFGISHNISNCNKDIDIVIYYGNWFSWVYVSMIDFFMQSYSKLQCHDGCGWDWIWHNAAFATVPFSVFETEETKEVEKTKGFIHAS